MSTVLESAVITAMSPVTFKKVGELFKSSSTVYGLEAEEISFRLRKTSEDNINLEMLMSNSEKGVMWYKPVCFYTNNNSIYLLHEFVNKYKELTKSTEFVKEPEYLELVENALIAAFSMEVFLMVEDAWLARTNTTINNGLEVDLDYSDKGLEVTVTERIEIGKKPNGEPLYYKTYSDRVGTYVLNGVRVTSINPFWDTKEAYDFVAEKKLLSALNKA